MPRRQRGSYRVVAVSLYEREAEEADRLTDLLKRAGWPKANRSLIVREALLLLQQELVDKDDEAVFRYFIERSARRLGRSHPPHAGAHAKRAEPPAAADDRPPRDLLDLSEREH
jgi:hypothetical protein